MQHSLLCIVSPCVLSCLLLTVLVLCPEELAWRSAAHSDADLAPHLLAPTLLGCQWSCMVLVPVGARPPVTWLPKTPRSTRTGGLPWLRPLPWLGGAGRWSRLGSVWLDSQWPPGSPMTWSPLCQYCRHVDTVFESMRWDHHVLFRIVFSFYFLQPVSSSSSPDSYIMFFSFFLTLVSCQIGPDACKDPENDIFADCEQTL